MITTKLLNDLHDGCITFGAFAAKTRGDFAALATNVARRWGKLPPMLQLEDLEQEMLLAVHVGMSEFDPDRGGIRMYIVNRVCNAARTELHRATQSKKRDDHGGLRLFPESRLRSDQEESRFVRQLLVILPNGERQTSIIQSLARTGDLGDTTTELLAHPLTRQMFAEPKTSHYPNFKRARRSVYLTARKLAQRAQAIA